MNWLRRVLDLSPAALAPAEARGTIRLPTGEVRAFVRVCVPTFVDRDTCLAWLPRFRQVLADLPGGAQPRFALPPCGGRAFWVVVWSPKGDTGRVLAAAERARRHLAPLLQQWPELVTNRDEVERLSSSWQPRSEIRWQLERGGDTWQFDWSPGAATLTRVTTNPQAPQMSLSLSGGRDLPEPTRPALPR